jgi:hypothetical protein
MIVNMFLLRTHALLNESGIFQALLTILRPFFRFLLTQIKKV